MIEICYLMISARSKQINKIKGCDYDGCGELSSLADASVWTCVVSVLWELATAHTCYIAPTTTRPPRVEPTRAYARQLQRLANASDVLNAPSPTEQERATTRARARGSTRPAAMAYQQTGGMLNNAASAAQANDHHGPQGAEYTLQGMSDLPLGQAAG